MKKLSPLVLSLICSSAMAGSYVDQGNDSIVKDNKDADHHFYVDLGVNGYYFDQPGTRLPVSYAPEGDDPNAPISTLSSDSYDDTNTDVMPTLTLGYEFLAPDARLQKIFGDQNAIEVRAAYFKSSSSTTDNYPDGYYVTPWYITGAGDSYANDGSTAGFNLEQADWNFYNTYYSLGIYYTGKKVLSDRLVNSPYVGLNFSYLKQDSDYTAFMSTLGDTPITTVGTDDLDTYYLGVDFGDKLAYLFDRQYAVYGKAGLGLYLMHTSLDATQLPRTGEYNGGDPGLYTTYSVTTDDDIATFKATAETGVSYYFSGNQNPLSMSVTLLAGVEYWNDVPYADNPTGPYEVVTIGYDNSVNPYAGLQFHMPIA
jgi:hypothetical protein